ncbi:MAG: hypothetical protein A2201_13075 [Alicyclobacillus sp. RIFOXYA1_FULL_53_8]|nr:MAG: hypothetical protein A2201_13075 [Alicyclobacillus sp. RIFOXYA1_FULL_53_8]
MLLAPSSHMDSGAYESGDDRGDVDAPARVMTTEIPLDFGSLLTTDKDTAAQWRFAFRQAAQELMEEGYRPTGFVVRQQPIKPPHVSRIPHALYIWTKER